VFLELVRPKSSDGRSIAQAISRRLPTAGARVQTRVWSCGILMNRSGAGAGFLRELRFPLPIYIPSASPQSSSLLPEVGTIGQEWPPCHPPPPPKVFRWMIVIILALPILLRIFYFKNSGDIWDGIRGLTNTELVCQPFQPHDQLVIAHFYRWLGNQPRIF
jgi:hypothetical protein